MLAAVQSHGVVSQAGAVEPSCSEALQTENSLSRADLGSIRKSVNSLPIADVIDCFERGVLTYRHWIERHLCEEVKSWTWSCARDRLRLLGQASLDGLEDVPVAVQRRFLRDFRPEVNALLGEDTLTDRIGNYYSLLEIGFLTGKALEKAVRQDARLLAVDDPLGIWGARIGVFFARMSSRSERN